MREGDERKPDRAEPEFAVLAGEEVGEGVGEAPSKGGKAEEPPPWLGEDGTDRGLPQPPAVKSPPQKASRKRITSGYLINHLTNPGYAFRLNLCDDSVVRGFRTSAGPKCGANSAMPAWVSIWRPLMMP
jgi:hypothetical protein